LKVSGNRDVRKSQRMSCRAACDLCTKVA